jgi:hypothetical protein
MSLSSEIRSHCVALSGCKLIDRNEPPTLAPRLYCMGLLYLSSSLIFP